MRWLSCGGLGGVLVIFKAAGRKGGHALKSNPVNAARFRAGHDSLPIVGIDPVAAAHLFGIIRRDACIRCELCQRRPQVDNG